MGDDAKKAFQDSVLYSAKVASYEAAVDEIQAELEAGNIEFPEFLRYTDSVAKHYGLNIEKVRPRVEFMEYEAPPDKYVDSPSPEDIAPSKSRVVSGGYKLPLDWTGYQNLSAEEWDNRVLQYKRNKANPFDKDNAYPPEPLEGAPPLKGSLEAGIRRDGRQIDHGWQDWLNPDETDWLDLFKQ